MQVPQHHQAVLSQGGRCGADVRRHSGRELQSSEAMARQRSGSYDLWPSPCASPVWLDVFSAAQMTLTSWFHSFFIPGSGGRRDSHPPPGKQDGHGRRARGVLQRRRAAGCCECSGMKSDNKTWHTLHCWRFTPGACRRTTSCSPRSVPTPARTWPSHWRAWPGRNVVGHVAKSKFDCFTQGVSLYSECWWSRKTKWETPQSSSPRSLSGEKPAASDVGE